MNAQELKEKYDDYTASQIKQFPARSTHASKIGHPCLRCLVYNRRDADKKILPSVVAKQKMDDGTEKHKVISRKLIEAGLDFKLGEKPVGEADFSKYEIGGRIDGFLNGSLLEIKTIGEDYSFKSINTIEDIKNHRSWWIKNYYAQMQTYLLLENYQKGVFLLEHRGNFKFIDVELDLEYAESLLKKAEAIKKHLEDSTYPDRMPYDEKVCGMCDFRLHCLPDMSFEGVEMLDNAELEAKLIRREGLKEQAKEFKQLDTEIKSVAKNHKELLVGNFHIITKTSIRKAYSVKESETKKVTIRQLAKKEKTM